MKIKLSKVPGILDINTGIVVFNNIQFKDINEAVKYTAEIKLRYIRSICNV